MLFVVVCCMMRSTWCVIVCLVLCRCVRCLSAVVCDLLCDVCCLLFVVCCLLCVVGVFIVC